MRTRLLTITFLIILFVIAGLNLMNDMDSLKPAAKYALGREVSGVETVNDAVAVTESHFNSNFVTKYPFIELNSAADRLMGSWIVNDRVKMKCGSLVQQTYEMDMSDEADEIGKLNAYLKERDIPFMYFAIPNKIKPEGNELRPGIVTYSNDNVDDLLAGLDRNDVHYMDLRVNMGRDFTNWEDQFFVTDHHWLPETAFWAYRQVATEMNESMGFELDPVSMNRDNWTEETYEDIFLGSSGKRTGVSFAGLDDFTLLKPKFDTHMKFVAPLDDMSREGTYREAVFEDRHLYNEDYMDLYDDNPYAAYIGGYELVTGTNESAVNDGTLLILRDSYTTAMQPYMSFMFSRVDAIDLREYDEMSLIEYIDKTKPAAVIMGYSPGTLYEKELFEYGFE